VEATFEYGKELVGREEVVDDEEAVSLQQRQLFLVQQMRAAHLLLLLLPQVFSVSSTVADWPKSRFLSETE
jgi:hypothetical protein